MSVHGRVMLIKQRRKVQTAGTKFFLQSVALVIAALGHFVRFSAELVVDVFQTSILMRLLGRILST
jgi:hypothetical protein